MNSKFYVSLESARLLKEKGYDRECIAYYQNDEFHPYAFSRYDLSINDKNAAPSYMNQYSAPTKAEVIDWLESKGIIIGVKPYTVISFSYFILIDRKSSYDVIETNECFPTRLEAEEAAIIKALELITLNT
jgi:hypothetical protein